MHLITSTYKNPWMVTPGSLIILLILLSSPHAMADETPEALVIRADRLPVKALSKHSVIPARDPFAWPMEQLRRLEESDDSKKIDPFADFTLNGIIWTEEEPVAIINNKPLRRGDIIDGAKIQDIEKNGVVIADRRTSRKLSFPDQFIELTTDGSNANN